MRRVIKAVVVVALLVVCSLAVAIVAAALLPRTGGPYPLLSVTTLLLGAAGVALGIVGFFVWEIFVRRRRR